jgi:hypothetical protein
MNETEITITAIVPNPVSSLIVMQNMAAFVDTYSAATRQANF